jgi:MFS family permease
MTDDLSVARTGVSPRRMLAPLALAQFICSFAGSNMNVMINDISKDLDTTVQGVQIAITLFLLVMAALMIPGSKLSDRWGRKRCFTMGLAVYGVGALLSALSPGLGVLILGNSVLEGVGSALLIPPVYILTTLLFSDLQSRARAFGRISGMGGIGAATGRLIGGLITTVISWRAAFLFQTAVVVAIVLLSRKLVDPLPPDSTRPFDAMGAVLSALGMLSLVVGILQAGDNRLLMVVLLALGAALLFWFFLHIRAMERSGRNRCCRPSCSATASPTSAWSPRTSSGCCCWGSRSSSRSSSRPFVATTPSRPASSSRRRPSASWSPPSGPSGSPAGVPRRA